MHQPLRYWPGPPPFAPMNTNAWAGGGGSSSGGGATGTYGSHLSQPFNNEQVTTLAIGLICIGSADGRLVPLVPLASTPMPYADPSLLATGTICVLSNGKVVAANQQVGAYSNGQVSPSTALCLILSNDGKLIPMNLCGG